MSFSSMRLQVLLPSQVMAEVDQVQRIVIDTSIGSLGLLPNRQDCSAIIVPGILLFDTVGQGETLMAVDRGVLLKVGREVRISVRRAIRGQQLTQLRQAVSAEFLRLNDEEQQLQNVMMKLETGFIHRFSEYQHEAGRR